MKCPKCGSPIEAQRGIYDVWQCGSDGWDGVVCDQSDACRRLAELEAENAKLREACEAVLVEFKTLGQAMGEYTPPETVDVWNKVEAALAKKETTTEKK